MPSKKTLLWCGATAVVAIVATLIFELATARVVPLPAPRAAIGYPGGGGGAGGGGDVTGVGAASPIGVSSSGGPVPSVFMLETGCDAGDVWTFVSTGVWSCDAPAGGSGDLTAVTASSPLAVTDGTGPVPALSMDETGCIAADSWQFVSAGVWACNPTGDITGVTASTGLTGGGTSGAVSLSVDPTAVQTRVTGTCGAGSSIRVIAQDGTVTCETDDDAGGDITSVVASNGLTGGGVSGAVSLALLYPNAGVIIYDDVMSCSTTGNMGGLPITVSGAGAGCVAQTTTASSQRPSVLGLSGGTTTTGRSAWASTGTTFFDSGVNWVFETKVSPQALSDGTNTWTWRGGFCDVVSGADCVDGVYFEYDQTASANWRCKTAANSVRTATNSSVAVAVNTYPRLKITLTEDSSALFEIDGVAVCGGAITATIPSGSARNTFLTPGVTNTTAGTVNTRAMDTDYWWFVGIFDTAR